MEQWVWFLLGFITIGSAAVGYLAGAIVTGVRYERMLAPPKPCRLCGWSFGLLYREREGMICARCYDERNRRNRKPTVAIESRRLGRKVERVRHRGNRHKLFT